MQLRRDVDILYRCADVLLKLVQQRRFEMFVHPIAPVLNETRHVVAPFNHKLKQQVIVPDPAESCCKLCLVLLLLLLLLLYNYV